MELLSKSEIAREKNDRLFLCYACAKGWLSAIEATYTLLHFSLRDNLHIECYYERALDFDNIWGIEEGVTYPFLQWQVDTTPPAIRIDVPTETNSVYRNGGGQFFLREFLLHRAESEELYG